MTCVGYSSEKEDVVTLLVCLSNTVRVIKALLLLFNVEVRQIEDNSRDINAFAKTVLNLYFIVPRGTSN